MTIHACFISIQIMTNHRATSFYEYVLSIMSSLFTSNQIIKTGYSFFVIQTSFCSTLYFVIPTNNSSLKLWHIIGHYTHTKTTINRYTINNIIIVLALCEPIRTPANNGPSEFQLVHTIQYLVSWIHGTQDAACTYLYARDLWLLEPFGCLQI